MMAKERVEHNNPDTAKFRLPGLPGGGRVLDGPASGEWVPRVGTSSTVLRVRAQGGGPGAQEGGRHGFQEVVCIRASSWGLVHTPN